MRWTKNGLVFAPAAQYPWVTSHAALPVAYPLGGPAYRVYFSGRDALGRSQIGAFDVDIDRPNGARDLTPEPLVALGPVGAFDDSGVTMSCLVARGGELYLYYTGWALGVTVPFYFFVGLAVSSDGGRSFAKVSEAPVLDRSGVDPYLTASPSVLVESGVWRMWYVSCARWTMHEGKPRHHYHIRYAESRDGIAWDRDGTVSVDFATPDEYAFARPHVVVEGGVYKMWYAVRGERYRIGYAESRDGIAWTRLDDEAGIDVSPDGWDAEMVEYPFVFDHEGRRYMLYNGNGYGKTGIGLATLDPGGENV